MTPCETILRLYEHVEWADGILLRAVEAAGDDAPEAVREYAHLVGAEELWLARIQGRTPLVPVWPAATASELGALVRQTRAAYAAFLADLAPADLEREISYRNSAGRPFINTVADILLHVALHAQYHRGKVNLLLRQGGHEPAPTDYIAYVRWAPAARTDPERIASV